MNLGSLSRLLLQVLGFAFCTIVGALISDLMDETWITAVGIGFGLIIASAIGALLEIKKPIAHPDKIENYSKRIPFSPVRARFHFKIPPALPEGWVG
jgi:hypothetical protein